MTGAPVDVGATVKLGSVDDNTHFVEDDGPGLDDVAGLFSINRPMRSTKLLRLPQRGALH